MALTKVDDRGLKTPIDLLDNEKIRFGNSDDLEIYHNGSHSYITDTGTGNLYIHSNYLIVSNVAGTEDILKANADGAVTLYFDGSEKLATTSTGVTVTGKVLASGGNFSLMDSSAGGNGRITFGGGDDLQIYHTGSQSRIENNTGELRIQSDTIQITDKEGNDMHIECNHDGNVELYYDNAKKAETTGTGFTVTGVCTATSFAGDGSNLTGISAGTALTGSMDNTVCTVTGANAIQGESNVRIDSNGRVLVGAASANVIHNQNANAAGDSTTPLIYTEGTGDSKSLTIVSDNTNAWRGSVLGLGRTRGTSVGDNTIVADGDNVGQIVFPAADGTNIRHNCASIRADIDGTPGENDVPGRLVFSTTADGAALTTERMRINSNGDLCVGKTSAIGKAEIATSASEIGLTVSNSVHDSQLQILATAADKNSSIFFGDNGDGNVGHIDYDHNDNNLNFRVNSAERLRIDSSGRVGINDSTPTEATLRVVQHGFSTCPTGLHIHTNGEGGGSGTQYALKISGTSANSCPVYGIHIDKAQQYTENVTGIYCKAGPAMYSNPIAGHFIVHGSNMNSGGFVVGVKGEVESDSGSNSNRTSQALWGYNGAQQGSDTYAIRADTVVGGNGDLRGYQYLHGGSTKFYVNSVGNVWSSSNSYSSDRDIKEDIQTLTGTSLNLVKQLVPKTFKWRESKEHEKDGTIYKPDGATLTGFIAQEVQAIIPGIVTGTDGSKEMGINYNGLVAHLVNTVKELSTEIDTLKTKVAALEAA